MPGKTEKFWYTGTSGDFTNTKIYGVRGKANVPSSWGGGAKDKNFWWGFYYTPFTDSTGAYVRPWSQIGASSIGNVFHWYHLGGGGEYTPDGLSLITPGSLVPGSQVMFTTENVSGSNIWNYMWDDKVIYQADMGIDYGFKIEIYAEIRASRVTSFPLVTANPALEWKDALGIWRPVTLAIVKNSTIPMAGQEQGLSLPNMLRFGDSKDKILAPGTLLWKI